MHIIDCWGIFLEINGKKGLIGKETFDKKTLDKAQKNIEKYKKR
jgi:hypothetical protein